MNSHSFLWREDMRTHEGIVLAQVMGLPVDTDQIIRETTAQGCIGKEIPDAAFDIHPAIGFGGTCLVTDCIKNVEPGTQMKSKGFEHISPLVEGHFP